MPTVIVSPGLFDIARCGGWLTARNGTLTSPNYPAGTESGIDCIWTIQVPRGHYVELSFIDVRLEDAVNGACRFNNFIELRDYNDTGLLTRIALAMIINQYFYHRDHIAPKTLPCATEVANLINTEDA